MTGNKRWILHVDMDSFFVALARRRDPALCGKPVAVGGSADARGVISSASYEARAFGVASAMPVSIALRRCPDLIMAPVDRDDISESSKVLRSIFKDYSPVVDPLSVDEAFIDLSGTERLSGSAFSVSDSILRRIKEQMKLPASGGLGSSRIIAKVASGSAKPSGLLYVMHGREKEFLAPMTVRRLPGIGPKAADLLARYGITKIRHLQAVDEKTLTRLYGEHAASLRSRALGGDRIRERAAGRSEKSISHERTFPRNLADFEELAAVLGYLLEKSTSRLRKRNYIAGTVTLKLRSGKFRTITRSITLSARTDSDSILLPPLLSLLERNLAIVAPVRLLGVCLSDLSDGARQSDLFQEPETELYDGIDSIRDRFGFESILAGRSFLRQLSRNRRNPEPERKT